MTYLKWNTHIAQICERASSTLGLERRTFCHCPQKAKILAHQSLVRPKLEYASTVSDPRATTNITDLERIQRSAARFVFSYYRQHTSPSVLIAQLEWSSLSWRRSSARFTVLHYIANYDLDISVPYLQANLRHSNTFHNYFSFLIILPQILLPPNHPSMEPYPSWCANISGRAFKSKITQYL